MNTQLQNKLYKAYPKIFAQKDLDRSQSAMSRGLCVGDGWHNLIRLLCKTMQSYIDHNRHMISKQVEMRQVKEKFGGLRIYIDFVDIKDEEKLQFPEQEVVMMNEIRGMLSFSEVMSYTICEECGKPGIVRKDLPWIRTLCQEHYEHEVEHKPY